MKTDEEIINELSKQSIDLGETLTFYLWHLTNNATRDIENKSKKTSTIMILQQFTLIFAIKKLLNFSSKFGLEVKEKMRKDIINYLEGM